jgi:hypothetical protein
MKDRNVKQVRLGEGTSGVGGEGEWRMYEDRTLKPVEIILSRGEGDEEEKWWG